MILLSVNYTTFIHFQSLYLQIVQNFLSHLRNVVSGVEAPVLSRPLIDDVVGPTVCDCLAYRVYLVVNFELWSEFLYFFSQLFWAEGHATDIVAGPDLDVLFGSIHDLKGCLDRIICINHGKIRLGS